MSVRRGVGRQRKLPKGDPDARVHRPPVRPSAYQLLEKMAETERLSVAAVLDRIIRQAASQQQ